MAQLVPARSRFSTSGCVLAPALLAMMFAACGGQTVPYQGDFGDGLVTEKDATIDVADGGSTGDEVPVADDGGSGEGSTGEGRADSGAGEPGADGGEGGLVPAEGGVDSGEDAHSPDGAADAASDSASTGKDAAMDAPAEGSTPACSPGCPDGNACGEARDCASSSCVNGTCAPSVPCGSTCAPGATCISEAVPVTNEGQSCPFTCGGGSDIARITTVYATNCNPTPCPSAVSTCPGQASCAIVLDNAVCGGDPCLDTPKGWSVTVSCN